MDIKQRAGGCRFIYITGGVVSSLGKGITAAALAALLQSRGYKVRLRKLDPYLNVDPGTMNPDQHGEVFITSDGAEGDLDLGHYERFTGINVERTDSTTSGKMYSQLIENERRGVYLGSTVQMIPHLTDLIKDFILYQSSDVDFMICEIGGTVGDIEALPYFEGVRQLGYELGAGRSLYIHVTLVPYIAVAAELKTKPTQHSVKELRSIGINPDILLCRSDRSLPESDLEKIGLLCNIPQRKIIQALDNDNIYKIPLAYHDGGLDTEVLDSLNIQNVTGQNLEVWKEINRKIETRRNRPKIKLAIVGKYTKHDAYKSLVQAIEHASIATQYQVEILWVDATLLDDGGAASKLGNVDAVIVPGGFGKRGSDGKVNAIKYAREFEVPFLGICFGMQLAVVEFARNVVGIKNANSAELVAPDEDHVPVITLASDWIGQSGNLEQRVVGGYLGGTMRLGVYNCKLVEGSKIRDIYGQTVISERHRHRYELNNEYQDIIEKAGMRCSGIAEEYGIVEIIELPNHPHFFAVQFHPELKSRPFLPHPLFISLINSAFRYSNA